MSLAHRLERDAAHHPVSTSNAQAPLADSLRPLDWVTGFTDLSRSTIYRLIEAGAFPSPIRLSPRRIAWRESDIAAWLNERMGGVK